MGTTAAKISVSKDGEKVTYTKIENESKESLDPQEGDMQLSAGQHDSLNRTISSTISIQSSSNVDR